ncbi:uncharacterized protein LOC134822433 isoform X2 [Bolinopsis microptera]|uniref:uncharacterized protein LOC134822433 isoform X2 n=1 Tax=Bolinopsis microptera TaxID=2820187 RepID=UPI003079E990
MILMLLIWGTEAANSFETPTTFSFLQQPISQSVEHGSSVTFNCTAKYEQYSVRYRWYRLSEVQIPPDENNHLNQTSSIISIDIYKSDSKLLFQCRAESEGQVIYSDVAKVTIAYFEYKGNPLDKLLEINEPMMAVASTLSCNEQVNLVTSNDPFEVVWFKGGQNVSQFRDARIWMSATETEVIIKVAGTELTLISVKRYDLVLYNFRLAEDQATYFCKVVQGTRSILVAAWTVQVRLEFNSQEYFISKPVAGYLTDAIGPKGTLSNEVKVGSNITLLCGGVGYCSRDFNRISYTWYKEDIIIAKGRQYRLPDGESGKFQCAVRCGSDMVTDKVTVTVPQPVDSSIEVEFADEPPVYKGYILGTTLGNIQIPCSVLNPAQFRRVYYYNGEEIEVPITVNRASRMKSGVVQCAFLDKLTQTIWVQRLTQIAIIGKPEIFTSLPENMAVGTTLHVFERESVTFSFNVTCPGNVQVDLYTDGVRNTVCEDGVGRYFNEECTVQDDVYTISIDNFTQVNERTYRLEVTHNFYKESTTEAGQKYSLQSYTDEASVRLILVKKCESSLSPVPDLAVFVFPKSVTLTCTGTGFPVPDIQFFKDDKPLGNWASSCQKNAPEGERTCGLKLSRYSDSGEYSCRGFSSIRRQKKYCNTTAFSVNFVGDPTVHSVVLQEKPAPAISSLICTAEGNTNPDKVYWLGNDSKVIQTEVQEVGKFRSLTSLNISDATQAGIFRCCVQQNQDTAFCKEVELRERPVITGPEEEPVNMWERQEKLTIGLICGGVALVVVLIIVGVVCYWRRKRAKKLSTNGSAEPAYAVVETVPKAPKAKASKSKQNSHDAKDKSGQYTEVAFEPKSGPRKSRPKKPDHENGESSNYTSVMRVRPVSNPRYANNL